MEKLTVEMETKLRCLRWQFIQAGDASWLATEKAKAILRIR
jgi:hypothetical protein